MTEEKFKEAECLRLRVDRLDDVRSYVGSGISGYRADFAYKIQMLCYDDTFRDKLYNLLNEEYVAAKEKFESL